MANNSKEEPKNAPQSDRWYNLTLGPSFKDDLSNKYCTLRYEFKPASIDKTKPGTLHKNKDNRVSLEFQNNQVGKPNVTFEGSSEDYKENDAVLFFNGESFRLERLHRAVKQLRHKRLPGESATSISAPLVEPKLAQVAKAPPKNISLGSFKLQVVPPPPVPVEVERIDVGEPEIPNSASKSTGRKDVEFPPDPPIPSAPSPGPKGDETEENQDIDMEELFGNVPDDEPIEDKTNARLDINAPKQNDTDDEIADVEDSGDEAGRGPNAAEALRAQVEQSSSSSSSSGSGSSGSGSGSGSSSSSSDSEGSDEDSVNSI